MGTYNGNKKGSSSSALLLLVLLFFVILGISVIYAVNKGLFVKAKCENKIIEQALPVAPSLLTNPMVYEWSGATKGRVVSKDEHSFTLQDDAGNRITVTDQAPNGSIFNIIFTNNNGDGTVTNLSLSDIPLNTRLNGNFYVFLAGKNIPVGGRFSVIK